jgi:hypothetical protein
MIYPFKCDACGEYEEVIRPALEAGRPQTCACGLDMRRIYTVPHVNVQNLDGYNLGLGCKQRDVKDKLAKIQAETGRELVEIGNERIKYAPKHNNYELNDKDVATLNSILDK